ncbi:MAG: diguanylate cyclase (GGDEF)-like protein/PAS domain S-box-containing protein [Gammaproteobacteria bacterium]|jgi:diguanylate cyclase (GGDEF)-like protein/PAS domain S-box-containing protein
MAEYGGHDIPQPITSNPDLNKNNHKSWMQNLRVLMFPESKQIRAEQLRFVQQQIPSAITGSLIILIALLATLRESIPLVFLIAWGSSMIMILGWRRYTASKVIINLQQLQSITETSQLLIFQVLLTGLLWGFGVVFMMGYTTPAMDVVVLIAMFILSVGAILYIGAYLPAYIVFLLVTMLPMYFAVISKYPEFHWGTNLICLAFIPSVLNAAIQFSQHVLDKIRLQTETTQLSHQLYIANDDLKGRLFFQQSTEMELKKNQSFLNAIFDNAPVEIYLKDHDGRYLRISRQFEKIFSVKNSDVIGKLPTDVHGKELGQRTRKHDLKVLAEGQTVIREVTTQLPGTDDHIEHTLLTVKFPLKDEDENILGIGAVVTDITGLKEIEARIRHHKERFEDFAESAADYYWETNQEMKITYISGNIEFLEKPENEIVGRRLLDLFADRVEEDDTWHEHIRLIEQYKPYSLEFAFLNSDGQKQRYFSKAKPLFDSDGDFQGYRGVGRDITREYRLKQDIVFQANHDPLTGVLNRRRFLKLLDDAISKSRNNHAFHHLCFLDLDKFKMVNDSAGHAAGDAFLRVFAGIVTSKIQKGDHVGRLGGDEFGVLLVNSTHARAKYIADSIIKELNEVGFKWDEKKFAINVSIGISSITNTTTSMSSLLSDVDQACYKSKEHGSGSVYFSSRTKDLEGKSNRYARHSDWLDGFEKSRIKLFAQPIYSLNSVDEPPNWFEILIRLQNDEGEFHSPTYFIPSAERFGQISQVDSWVVQNTVEHIRKAEHNKTTRYSINLSGASLQNEKVRDLILEQITDLGKDAERICFEITETSAINNLSVASGFIERLRGEGCKFALDDFGSGLSSYTYLKHLPINYLKIDGSFIRNIGKEKIDLVFVQSICTIADALGMQTIAECVESKAIIESLLGVGVDFGQGKALGVPLALEHYLEK